MYEIVLLLELYTWHGVVWSNILAQFQNIAMFLLYKLTLVQTCNLYTSYIVF